MRRAIDLSLKQILDCKFFYKKQKQNKIALVARPCSRQVLPDPKDYIPPLAEGVFNRNEVDLSVNKSRRTLFKGKLFVFSSPDQV